MPVKIWGQDDHGSLISSVETSRRTEIRGEDFRSEAEALDSEIDLVLDHAVELSSSVKKTQFKDQIFVKCWAIGRSIAEKKLLESNYLDPQELKSLWRAMARKCRLGVRADSTPEERWHDLIPARKDEPIRIELDVFALGLWLQEQELSDAIATFGASITNAKETHRRKAISSKNLRDNLGRWFETLGTAQRSKLMQSKNFIPLAKALAARFPARGPGSAKRPVHYPDDELYKEISMVLEPLANELAQ